MSITAGSSATVEVERRDAKVVSVAGSACYSVGENRGIRLWGAGSGRRQHL